MYIEKLTEEEIREIVDSIHLYLSKDSVREIGFTALFGARSTHGGEGNPILGIRFNDYSISFLGTVSQETKDYVKNCYLAYMLNNSRFPKYRYDYINRKSKNNEFNL